MATATHAAAAIPAIHGRRIEPWGPAKAMIDGRLTLSISIADLMAMAVARSTQHVNVNTFRELCRIRASLEHVYLFELLGVQRDLPLERRPDRMIVMSVACEHGGEIFQRTLAPIARVHRGRVGGMVSDQVASLEYGPCQCACRGRLSTDETAAHREHAADAVGKLSRETCHDLVELAVLAPDIGARVIVRECLGLALLHGKREELYRVLAPLDLPA